MFTLFLVAAVVLRAEASGPPSRAGEPPLRVELRARALVPGEPVRVLARAEEPIRSLTARFLDQEVYLAPEPGRETDRGEIWSGWAAIPLDQKPGRAGFELEARTVAGRGASLRLLVPIEEKRFPVERLRVADRYVVPPPEEAERIERERKQLASIFATRTAPLAPWGPFLPPVPGKPASPYGVRRILNGKPRAPHPGLDLPVPEGTPVRSAAAGRVVFAGELYFSGRTVILDHGAGLFTLYAHLSEVAVREGARVRAGEPIGRSGATGRVTGPHLHWGAKIGERAFDPSALFEAFLFEARP